MTPVCLEYGHYKSGLLTIAVKHFPRKFRYEDIFAAQPNITTDRSWLGLFPLGGGFFKHPTLAPEKATFAVYHQLHCLVSLCAYETLLPRLSHSYSRYRITSVMHTTRFFLLVLPVPSRRNLNYLIMLLLDTSGIVSSY